MGTKRTADMEEGDLSDFDANSAGCTADASAAKNGNYGLLTANNTTDANYARWSDPNQESPNWVEMWVKAPANMSAVAKTFAFCYTAGTIVWRARMRFDSGYKMDVGLNDDGFSFNFSSEYTFTADWHKIKVLWAASTSDGADDGYIRLFDSTVEQVNITGVDNDTFPQYVDIIDVGMPEGAWNLAGLGMLQDDIRWGDGLGPSAGNQAIWMMSKFYDELKKGIIPSWDLQRRYKEVFI